MQRPTVNWNKMDDRDVGAALLNELARMPDQPWSGLGIPQNGWLQWRDALLSPPWATCYPPNQPQMLVAYRTLARQKLTAYAQPSDATLRHLVDVLAVAEVREREGKTTASDTVWSPEELVAVALGLWLARVPPDLDDQGERSALPHGTIWTIQTLLPHRTQPSIRNAINRRLDQIIFAYDWILEVGGRHGR